MLLASGIKMAYISICSVTVIEGNFTLGKSTATQLSAFAFFQSTVSTTRFLSEQKLEGVVDTESIFRIATLVLTAILQRRVE